MNKQTQDKTLEDLFFLDGLNGVTRAIESMTEGERRESLFRLIEKEVKEGKNWERDLIKRLLIGKE